MNRETVPVPGPVTEVGPPGQRRDAGHVQADRFQQQHGEEQVGLKAERQPGQARSTARLGLGKDERADRNVGVRA